MPNIPSIEEMLKAGVHFGHKSSRWHPKMNRFIFDARQGVHIINLEETQKMLQEALDFVKGIAARGGTVLFVGTKSQAKGIVEKYADEVQMPYVTERWLGGTLTNWAEIKRVVKKLIDLRDKMEKGELKKYTKKEQLWFKRDIEDMERKVGGIQTMTKLPEALFIVDLKADKTAFNEAEVKGIKVVALSDTNVNPTDVSFPIPANDDGVNSIEMMTKLVAEAIKEGKANPVKVEKEKKVQKAEKVTKVKKEVKEVVDEIAKVVDKKVAEDVKEELKEKATT